MVRIDIVGTTYTQILAIVFISRVYLTLNFIKLISLTLLLPSFLLTNVIRRWLILWCTSLWVQSVCSMRIEVSSSFLEKIDEMGGLVLPKKKYHSPCPECPAQGCKGT